MFRAQDREQEQQAQEQESETMSKAHQANIHTSGSTPATGPRTSLTAWLRETYALCAADPDFSPEQIKRVHRVYRVVLPLYACMAVLTTITMWRHDPLMSALWSYQLLAGLGTYVALLRRPTNAHRVMQVGLVLLFVGMVARVPHVVIVSAAADVNLHGLTSAIFAGVVVTHTLFSVDAARRLNRVFVTVTALAAIAGLSYFGRFDLARTIPVLRLVLCAMAMVTLTGFMSELQGEHSLLQAQHKMMEQLALTDTLTNLANRRAFESLLGREVARANRHGGPLSVILIDVDHFKLINDQLGHDAGDNALTAIAAILREQLRASDEPARWAGDEFAIVLPATPITGALVVAERIRAAVARGTGAGLGPITVSLGVAELERGKDDTASLMRRADRGLYRAKRQGRNCSASLEAPPAPN
jgi:diguanylate cyclase (GGDEF)-like protein